MSESSDQLLIRQIQDKNQIVFESIYEEYYPRLVAFAEGYTFDLEESQGIVQNFFVHLWLNTDQLQASRSLKSYFFTAIKNRCLNHIRDLNIRDRHNLQYIEAELSSRQTSPKHQTEDLESDLLKEIQTLPQQMKEILILKYFENKKRQEIAQTLGISENTVKTQLNRGKKKLFKQLKDKKLVGLLVLFHEFMA